MLDALPLAINKYDVLDKETEQIRCYYFHTQKKEQEKKN
jgi:hypothetical protein